MRARRNWPTFTRTMACALALVGSLAHAAFVAAAEDGLPEPLCWRQQAFSIPFKVATAESPDQQPAEVRLYVSANSGAKWDLSQTLKPEEHSFTFRAPHDGEYWFQIRTADRQGHVTPEIGGKPELRVIVDTMPPRLDLTATRGEAGEVKASWQAVDPLLNPDSLKIEYQTASGSWRPVAVDRAAGGANRSTTSGTLTWFPTDAPAGSVSVRAEISDRAGNTTVSQAQAAPGGSSSSNHDLTAGNKIPSAGQSAQNWMSTPNQNWSTVPPPSSPPASNFNSAAPSTSGPALSGPAFSNSASAPAASNYATPKSSFIPNQFTNNQFASSGGSTAWPADRSSDVPLGRNPIPADDLTTRPSYGDVASRAVENVNPPIRNQAPSGNQMPSSNQTRNDSPPLLGYNNDKSQGYANDNPPQSYPAQSNSALQNQALSNPSQSNPALSIPAPSTNTRPADRTAPSNGMLPPGERPRMVNARSFDLDYEVDGIGPSGIAKVELWGTRDGGRNWSSYGIDDDNRSPIRANVEGEGLYGFRIVVQSGNGLGGLPPHSGDAPDLWVMVDLTKPAVRLLDATAGDGPHSGELLIRWEASDAALAPRPITLRFSDRPGGQYSIIAAGLDNTGQYAWRPDSRAPDRIYLRIEARDEAGNIGIFDAAQPVTLDRIRPEGRIRGVRPTTDTAAGAAYAPTTATGPQVYDFSR